MWDNWNLPMFLLGDESLTLIYMVSTFVNISQYWVGMWSCTNNQVLNHLEPGVTHCTTHDAICGKYKIFLRPNEAMLFVTMKACLCSQNILLFKTIKDLSLL